MPTSGEGERIRQRFLHLSAISQQDWDMLRREQLEVSAHNHLRRDCLRIARTLDELKSGIEPKFKSKGFKMAAE